MGSGAKWSRTVGWKTDLTFLVRSHGAGAVLAVVLALLLVVIGNVVDARTGKTPPALGWVDEAVWVLLGLAVLNVVLLLLRWDRKA